MATQVIGVLAVNNILPTQARAAGSFNFGPVALPVGYSGLWVQFDLTQVTSLTPVFSFSFDLSFDNGSTWTTVNSAGLDLALSGYVITGGVLTRAADDAMGPGPVRVFGGRVGLTQTESSARQVRGVLTCSQAVASGATIYAY